MVPKFFSSWRIVVENVKSGDRFIKSIARFKDRVGVERFRICPSMCVWINLCWNRKGKNKFLNCTDIIIII